MNDFPLGSLWKKDKATGAPSEAWIQWKGTSVCMDVRCECGALTHIDAEFCYFIECGACHRKFLTGQYITLVPLTEAEAKLVIEHGNGFNVSEV